MNKAGFFLFLLMFAGCATPPQTSKPAWSELNMPGLILDLKDPKYLSWYLFHSDGMVSASFGKRGGYIVSPLFDWKAKGDVLIITDDNKSVMAKLRLLEIQNNKIRVQNSAGIQEIYTVKRN